MLSYQPHEISAATIYVAAEFIANSPHLIMLNDEEEGNRNHRNTNGASPRYTQPQQPYDGTKESNWWRRFDIDDAVLEKICTLIMDLYESPYVRFECEDVHKREYEGNGQSKKEDSGNENGDEDDDLVLRTPSPKATNVSDHSEPM